MNFENVDFKLIDHFEKVSDKEGAIMARRLSREEGIMVGYSAGSAVAGINQMKNKLSKDDFEWSLRKLSIILQPFVPHISEEIWSCIGNKDLCINENWEEESVGAKTKFKIAIQINGKTREIIEVDDTISKKEVMEIAIKNNKVSKNLSGKTVLREIYVPGKIINLVTK